MKIIFFIMATGSLLFFGCHTHKHHHDHDSEEAVGHEHEHSGAIHFETGQQEKIDFAVEYPLVESFGQVIKTTAQIQSSQMDETIISARTSGIVLFSGNNIVEGQTVNAGQVLFSVSGESLADNNSKVRFTEAQNNYQKAEADYRRAQELAREKIVSEKDFLQIQSEYETAKAIYDNLYKNFSNGGQKVSGSFAGYIKQIFVENGQYVEAGQALVSVSKNKSLILKADVPVKYAELLPCLSSATIRNRNKSATYSLEELNGKILSFGKSLNTDSYRLPVTIQIDNKAGFIPGAFVEVYLKTKSEQAVLTVPCSALTEEQGNYYVYVQECEEHFEKREVTIGITDGIRIEIQSGLNKEEQIVTKGAISVKLAQSTGALDPHAGHIH
jgi:RND family efflux transporter MFP subunit